MINHTVKIMVRYQIDDSHSGGYRTCSGVNAQTHTRIDIGPRNLGKLTETFLHVCLSAFERERDSPNAEINTVRVGLPLRQIPVNFSNERFQLCQRHPLLVRL